ncbi:MAG TPA: hypothetical protein VNO30_45435 [Kofleriaceae bacterium]|nr:hypothetical protein [Kofleriaceae bacterium]
MLTFDGDDHGYDSCRAVAAGVNDEIIVTGQTQRFAQGANAWLRAWSATGAVLWTHELSTPSEGQDAGNDVTVLSDGTAVVAGQWYSGASRQNHFLSRVSTAGAISTSYGELLNDDMYLGVARDNSNAIIAGGWRPDTGTSSMAWWRKLTLPNLTEVWSLTRNGAVAGPDAVNKLATDSTNAVIAVGYTATAAGRAGWIAKNTSSGGPPLWTSNIAATGAVNDGVYDVGVGPDDVVIAIGRSGTVSWIRAYSSTGVLAWAIREVGVLWRSVAVDRFGNIATAGNVGPDLYVRVHDRDGNVFWDYTYPNATGNGVAFDSLSNVLVCGERPAGMSSDALVLTLP